MINAPESRTWLPYWRRSVVAGVTASAVAVVVFVIAVSSMADVVDNAERLEAAGLRVPATVTDVVVHPSPGKGYSNHSDFVVVYAVDGVTRTATVFNIYGDRYSDVESGDRVTLLVDPEDSTNVTLPGERNEKGTAELGKIAALGLSVVVAVVAGKSLGCAWRARRRLRSAQWDQRSVGFRWFRTFSRRRLRGSSGFESYVVVSVLGFWPWPSKKVHFDDDYDVCGGRIVLLVPRNGGPPLLARRRQFVNSVPA